MNINFVYSYESFGSRHESSWMEKSTMTWEEFFKKYLPLGWQTDMQPVRKEWDSWAWPGGYPILYVVKDGGVLCPKCANKELPRTLDPDDDQFFIVEWDINHEDPEMYCDHCNQRIESAYCEDDRKEFYEILDAGNASELSEWVTYHPCFAGMA